MLLETFVRGIGAILFGVGGLFLGRWLASDLDGAAAVSLYTLLPAALGAAGAISSPYLSLRPARRLVGRRALTALQGTSAVLGLVLGLVVSALLAPSLTSIPGRAGFVAPLAVALSCAVLGLLLGASSGPALIQALMQAVPRPAPVAKRPAAAAERLILDTSAIIDGRIADICQTGFIQAALLIPRFILDELRYIADSPDALRRNRGRRGLEVLTRLQKEAAVPIQIVEVDFGEGGDVDAKLVRLAASYGCPIITNDYNLNQVAELEGIKVLNINQLASAVKTVVLPGEEIAIRIIQEGKELGQGVGFLDDGTMVVVEGGRGYLNGELDIVVTRVLQTVAGRMIFAQPKAGGVRSLGR